MKPKDRAIAAFNLEEPEDIVPTYELEFQLSQELLGKDFYNGEELKKAIGKERERFLYENAELMVEIAKRLDYSILRIAGVCGEDQIKMVKILKKMVGSEYLIEAGGDGTFGIPSGSDMLEFTYWLKEHPEEAKEEAFHRIEIVIEQAKKLVEAGVDVIDMCNDYCFNRGPFLSPSMFSEFVTPYLYQQIAEIRKIGAYTVKHTDGNIMPILEQLVSCKPHAIHSLDPMAGVDIAEVKKLIGDKVCLIGNVNCALLQTGTQEEIIKNAKYCIQHAAPGGGYIFSTSNVVFKGMPLDNYLFILDVRRRYGTYPMKNIKIEEASRLKKICKIGGDAKIKR